MNPRSIPTDAPCDVFFDFEIGEPTEAPMGLRRLIARAVAHLDSQLHVIFSPHGSGRFQILGSADHCDFSCEETTILIEEFARLSKRQSPRSLKMDAQAYAIREYESLEFSIRLPISVFTDVQLRASGSHIYPKGYEWNLMLRYARVPESITASREKALLQAQAQAATAPSKPSRSL